MSEVSMTYMLSDVEAMYPKLNRTYKFDNKEQRSVPCEPLDDGSEYSVNFRMSQEQAKNLFKAMSAAYKAKREDSWPEKIDIPFKKEEDGTFTHKAKLKGAYGKEATVKPSQVDAKKKPCPENFMLTTGSTANVAVVLFPYNMRDAGVSLRLRGVQVTKYVPLQTESPFDVVDGFTLDKEEEDMFADTPAPVAVVEVEVEEEVEAPVEEPKKKVVKQKSAAPKEEADLSALVEGWDD